MAALAASSAAAAAEAEEPCLSGDAQPAAAAYSGCSQRAGVGAAAGGFGGPAGHVYLRLSSAAAATAGGSGARLAAGGGGGDGASLSWPLSHVSPACLLLSVSPLSPPPSSSSSSSLSSTFADCHSSASLSLLWRGAGPLELPFLVSLARTVHLNHYSAG